MRRLSDRPRPPADAPSPSWLAESQRKAGETNMPATERRQISTAVSTRPDHHATFANDGNQGFIEHLFSSLHRIKQ
jgi:hypothetical protein